MNKNKCSNEEKCNCGCDENVNCECGCEEQAEQKVEASGSEDKFLRLAADFENFKKRTKAEKEALYGLSVCETVGKILPIFDDLERALAAAGEDSAVKKGVEQVLLKADSVLKAMNIEAFGAPGEEFDANYHEAVMQTASDEYKGGQIAAVFQKGYKMTTNEKVIRYAKVSVVAE
ncbi:MAG: nucleotide exchange factor GrpE [Clostridia bacterium]|nr:nucleotide exchange factor GrpE [Clostridia bacterium]